MKNTISQKIFNALNNGKLKITGGKRKWYNYIISIQELYKERNNKNGLIIDVYDLEENYLKRVNITFGIVWKSGNFYNEMILDKY